jgi:hypothetical protein
MSLDNAGLTGARALLAVGTASYESPDFADLKEVPAALSRVVETLRRFGYSTVTDTRRGYLIDPSLRRIQASIRDASRAAPIVVVYYMGHAVLQESGTCYLILSESQSTHLKATALPISDLLAELQPMNQSESVEDEANVLVILDCTYSESSEAEMLQALRSISHTNTWIIASFEPRKSRQSTAFATAFCQILDRARGVPSQPFLMLDYIVDAANDAVSERNQRAFLFPPIAGSVGTPPFFPNPSYEPIARPDSLHLAEDEAQPDAVARLIVPAITDDAVEGHPDSLGVDADARALAALVASRRLEPPLAIGLYGEWGSGKTFFMKRVQASIDDLATSGATDVFFSEVASVWFSAWQYADGNLWASLLHHIFASLYPAKSKPQLALDDMMSKVQGAQQVTLAVAKQVEIATTRLDQATEAIDSAKERHQKALQESSKLRGRDLWDAVKLSAADQELKNQVARAADDLGLTVSTESAQDLMGATRQIVDLASRARVLATSKPWYRSPLAYAIYAAVIVGSVSLLVGAVVHTGHKWTGTAITTIGQLAALGSAAAAWVSRQGSLARRFIAPAETLQRRLEERLADQQAENERELAALEREAETAKAELAVALQQHAAAEQELAIAEKERSELTGKRLLRRYLAERAGSGDYEHYMGVVALAHRDLVDLAEYLHAATRDREGKRGLIA